jgi:hypothetical protein
LAFLSTDLLAKVAEFTVWVPIKDLHVQSPLRLGPAELREISAKDVDLFLVEARKPEVRDEMLRKLSMYRGHAAMIFQIKAERDFAYEKACVLAERILSTLCVFSPSSTIGATHMSTSLWGSERRPQAAAIFLSKDGWQGMTEGARGSRPEVLSLSDGLVARNKVFFRHIHALLSSEDSNQFASEIIDALTIY